ncbi:hypothetical protein [Levilactobacillus spicheri]
MKKGVLLMTGVLLLGGLGAWGWHHHTAAPAPAPRTTQRATPPTKRARPLTLRELRRRPKLTYAALIDYAVHDTHVMRWQEVADYQAGWQVEIDRVHGARRYSVWPDRNIQTSEKKLEPNWFTLKGHRVTYQSFVVHSDGDYTVYRTTLKRVVHRLNAQHAAARVRRMPERLVVKDATR